MKRSRGYQGDNTDKGFINEVALRRAIPTSGTLCAPKRQARLIRSVTAALKQSRRPKRANSLNGSQGPYPLSFLRVNPCSMPRRQPASRKAVANRVYQSVPAPPPPYNEFEGNLSPSLNWHPVGYAGATIALAMTNSYLCVLLSIFPILQAMALPDSDPSSPDTLGTPSAAVTPSQTVNTGGPTVPLSITIVVAAASAAAGVVVTLVVVWIILRSKRSRGRRNTLILNVESAPDLTQQSSDRTVARSLISDTGTLVASSSENMLLKSSAPPSSYPAPSKFTNGAPPFSIPPPGPPAQQLLNLPASRRRTMSPPRSYPRPITMLPRIDSPYRPTGTPNYRPGGRTLYNPHGLTLQPRPAHSQSRSLTDLKGLVEAAEGRSRSASRSSYASTRHRAGSSASVSLPPVPLSAFPSTFGRQIRHGHQSSVHTIDLDPVSPQDSRL